MKSLLALLFFTIPGGALFGQTFPAYKNLKLENGQVFFEKVYNRDSMSAAQVEFLLEQTVPKVKNLTDFKKEGSVITGRLKGALVDYKSFGHKWGSTPTVLNWPFEADISIFWKDFKYKVTITNIVFKDVFGLTDLSDGITKKHRTQYRDGEGAVAWGTYTDEYLERLFDLKEGNW
ncbi:hypothetical protein [Chitinophaga parva]|nr:hypothetical protein [Chitinophaga parva]